MKTKTTGLILTLWFFGAALCFGDEPQMGTWKLNEANSMVTPGEGKVTMVVYEPAGDNVKVTIDGTDKDGNATHNEWTGKFDGKDYPVTGDPTSDTRLYKKINNRTMDFAIKKAERSRLLVALLFPPMTRAVPLRRPAPVRMAKR